VAVVINDFEVVAEPPPPDQAVDVKVEPPTPPTPHDLENILRRQQERTSRLRAH
jgi:hypothetical protein